MAPSRLGVLDGLRGIAVLLILWYHLWEISWLPAPLHALQFIPETGFVGVSLFFYISGFVIVYPFVQALARAQAPPAWGHFAYRRAIKIVPSYLLSIVVLVAAGYAHFTSAQQAAIDVGTHVLFIHTWWSSTYGSINGVLWTLAVEVQFYAIFPLLWLAFKRYPWITCAAMVYFSLLYRSYAAQFYYPWPMDLMTENLPGYLDIFALGMISAHLYVGWRDSAQTTARQAFATAAAIAGFVFLLVLLENLWSTRLENEWATMWQIHNRTLLGASFAFIGLGSLLALPAWKRALANPVLLFFAAISYNLYLYHQAIALLLRGWHIPPYAGTRPQFNPHWQIAYTIVAFAVTVSFAALVTYGFERPLLRVPMERLRKAFAPT